MKVSSFNFEIRLEAPHEFLDNGVEIPSIRFTESRRLFQDLIRKLLEIQRNVKQ